MSTPAYAPEMVTVERAALTRLLAETRAPVALGQIAARTAWEHLAERCGMAHSAHPRDMGGTS